MRNPNPNPNQSFFRWRLDDALSFTELPQRVLAVLYLDLDSFKPTNDAHGRDAGDELLRVIADQSTRSARAEDRASPMGGDEFDCLVTEAHGRENLIRGADDLLDVVSEPLSFGEVQVAVRPSTDIALAPKDGVTAAALLKNADVAMYGAKRRRAGFAFFSDCAST